MLHTFPPQHGLHRLIESDEYSIVDSASGARFSARNKKEVYDYQ